MAISRRTIFWSCTGLLIAVLLGLWLARLRIATSIVDGKLKAAGVPATYRITRVGPFLERLEDVRIGDPANPDLIARRIDARIGYGWAGLEVKGVSVDGVRLKATLARDGLHLGALDRLMPRSGGGQTKLPNLDLDVRDTVLVLATPNGAIQASLSGSGNPMRRFEGEGRIVAGALRLASCALQGTDARLKITVGQGKPAVRGPIAIGRTACGALQLGPGTAQVEASSDATFEHVALGAAPSGFGGTAGPTRFAQVGGTIAARGTLGHLGVQARLGFDHFALPAIARTVANTQAPAGLPITPIARSVATAAARLLADAHADAVLDADIVGENVGVRVQSAALSGPDGAQIRVTQRGGLEWSRRGWRSDGDVAIGGGGLPSATLALRQAGEGAPLRATGAVSPYRVGAAQLALSDLALGWDGRLLRFEGQALVDGPLGAGAVRGLDIGLQGWASDEGLLRISARGGPWDFAGLDQGGFHFNAARFVVRGDPIVARDPGGAVRIDAGTGPLRLTGHTSSGTPVTTAAAGLHVTSRALTAGDVAVTIGESNLRIASLDGTFGGGGIGGHYAGASGAVAHVPLLLSDGAGEWAFGKGALALGGALKVADAAPSPRFNPLVTEDMRLRLHDNLIDATATLREPKSRAAITDVALTHNLADSSGHATLAVPGITFVPKKLQPEALTPLTLGVVANVGGTVTGAGRIDWTAAGVTSTGDFATDKLDLAAAFGPVSGIATKLHFTDLLGLVSAPHQAATIVETNPGVAVTNGIVHYQLLPQQRVAVEDAVWPFAGGTLRLDPTTLVFEAEAERHLTFRVDALDAAAFVQQLDFPNIAATGRFDGLLPMIFDKDGGRIAGGYLTARPGGGTLAYVGELSRAQIGTMGKLAFDALKAIRYSALEIRFDGKLDGEMISRVTFTGMREATSDQSIVARLLHNLPFRFNIRIQAPFRGLMGTARTYSDPRLLLDQVQPTPAEPDIQPPASAPVR